MIFKLISNKWFKREVYAENQEYYKYGSVIQDVLDGTFRFQDFYAMCQCFGLKFKKVHIDNMLFLKGIKDNKTIIKAMNF